MNKVVLTLALVLSAFGCAREPESSALSPSADAAEALIDAEFIRGEVTVLAGDEMEGRGPGADGDRLARQQLVRRTAELGLEPGGPDGGWEQPFDIVGVTSRLPESWEFRRGSDAVSFRFGDEYMGASGVQREDAGFDEAEVVFVGYGIEAPEEGWDDFKGADLRGKVLLMLNDDPDWEPGLFAGERKLYYGRWDYKYESAARQGAAAAIIVHTTPSAGYPWIVVRTSWSGEQFQIPAGDDEPSVMLQAWLTEEASRRLVELAGENLDELRRAARSREFRPVPLGVTTSMRVEAEIRRTQTANVIGVLPGSDPELAREAVIFSAHHDHLGIGEPDESGDTIYNGALDNGVAMAQVLAVARAFAALPDPPRRSVIFLFPGAEEQGLLGSKYFAAHPTLPPGRIAADINFELGNIWGRTTDVTIFGKGKSTLEETLEALAAEQGRGVAAEKTLRAGWFYRSDQFSFARIGVPAIWFKSGTAFVGRPAGYGEQIHAQWIEENYHRPSDEVEEDWNYEGLVEDAVLGFRLGLIVANADEMPSWYPGDEFEDERQAALAALQD